MGSLSPAPPAQSLVCLGAGMPGSSRKDVFMGRMTLPAAWRSRCHTQMNRLRGGTLLKDQLIAGIKDALYELVPERWLSSLSEKTRLRDLGIDSVDMVRLITRLEEVFKVRFSADELAPENFRNVASLQRLLRAKGRGGRQL
jgi:acyl carrier protein